MKSRSHFGPVFLIALGVALLVNNLRPEVSLLGLFADGWPWILVFWGAFRIVESSARRVLGHAIPSAMGVGSVILAFLLVVGGSAAHYLRHNEVRFPAWTHGLPPFWGQEFEFPVEEKTLPAGGRSLAIRNVAGEVHITGGEPDALIVAGKKRVRAFGKDHASELNRHAELRITQNSDNIIEAAAGDFGLDRVAYDLQVRTPRATPLKLEAPDTISVEEMEESVSVENARWLDFSHVRGPITVQAARCRHLTARDLGGAAMIAGCRNIELRGAEGPVTIESSHLDEVRLSDIAQAVSIFGRPGRIELARLPGKLEAGKRSILISGGEGPVRLVTPRAGTVRLERVTGSVQISGHRGDLAILLDDTGFSALEATLDRGDLDLRLPEGAQFTLRAETARGSVRHEFGEAMATSSGGQSATITGGTGQGPEIRLRTGRGNIFVGSSKPETRKSVQL